MCGVGVCNMAIPFAMCLASGAAESPVAERAGVDAEIQPLVQEPCYRADRADIH